MARGHSVERDLATMLFESSSTEYLRERLKAIVGEEDFYKTMAQYAEELEDLQKQFENSWATVSKKLNELFMDSNGILDQMTELQIKVFSQNGSIEDRHNALFKYIQDKGLSTNISLINDLERYFKIYEDTYSKMLEGSAKLRQLGEEIRNDKLLYALGQQEKNGVVLSLMTAESYENFEERARNLFQLNVSKDGHLTGLGTRQKFVFTNQVQRAMEQAGIMDQLINADLMKSKLGNNTDLTYADVWERLRKTDIRYAGEVQKFGYDNAKSITDARKQEILLSGKFANVNTIDQIDQIIETNWGQSAGGFIAENVSQFAAGDTSIAGQLLNNNDTEFMNYAIQSKRANGFFGWNGTGIAGMISAFKFYSNEATINNVMSWGFEYNTGAMNQYVQDVLGFSGYEVDSYAENMATEWVGDTLSSMFAGNPNIDIS